MASYALMACERVISTRVIASLGDDEGATPVRGVHTTTIDDNAIGANHDPALGERPPTKRRMAGSASSRSQPTAYPYDAQAAFVKHESLPPVPRAF